VRSLPWAPKVELLALRLKRVDHGKRQARLRGVRIVKRVPERVPVVEELAAADLVVVLLCVGDVGDGLPLSRAARRPAGLSSWLVSPHVVYQSVLIVCLPQ